MRRAMRNLLVTGLLLGGGIAQAAERVGDFSLLDQNGVFHHMGWYEDSKAIAFLVQVNGSVDTRAAMADYQALAARFAEQGIEFMLINPLGEERASVKAQAGERFETLSERERQAFLGLVHGEAIKDIARSLGLSPRTVEKYRYRMQEKMGTNSLTMLVRSSTASR